MSELRVTPGSLDAAAGKAELASGNVGVVQTSDGMASVAKAMPGGASGEIAGRAANYMDGMAKGLKDRLDAFAEAVRAAGKEYQATDGSVSLDFSKLNATQGGGN